jgi:uncharacterized protein (DUF952 family)
MRIYHIATAADWAAAKRSGTYTTSTVGRTLEEEGFIHASHREQVPAVFRSFYRDVREPLVLLTIETDRLSAPWQEDPVGDETYPHIYGPPNAWAVVRVGPMNRMGGSESFTSLFAKEMFARVLLAVVAMLLAVIGSSIGRQLLPEWGSFLGAILGLAIGVVIFVVVLRRRS